MRTTMAIIKKFLIGTVRRRSTLLLMVGLPLLFTFVFGVVPGLAGNDIKVAVVDEDHTAISAALSQSISSTPGYHVSFASSLETSRLLRDQKVSYVMVFPKGVQRAALAGNRIPIEVRSSSSTAGSDASDLHMLDTFQTRFQRMVIAGKVAEVRALHEGRRGAEVIQAFVQGMSQSGHIPVSSVAKPIVFQDGDVQGSLSQGQQSVVGFATMFIIFTVFGQTSNLFEEKRLGTWDRLKASGSSKLSIVCGYGVSLFLDGCLQFLVMVLAGRYLFQIALPLNGWVALTASLYILAVAGIALCVFGLVTTAQQLSAIGSFAAIVTSMIGGAYWPLDLEPNWMQHIAWFVPQDWAMSSFRVIAVGAGGFHALALPLAVLAAFAIVFLGVGMTQLRYA